MPDEQIQIQSSECGIDVAALSELVAQLETPGDVVRAIQVTPELDAILPAPVNPFDLFPAAQRGKVIVRKISTPPAADLLVRAAQVYYDRAGETFIRLARGHDHEPVSEEQMHSFAVVLATVLVRAVAAAEDAGPLAARIVTEAKRKPYRGSTVEDNRALLWVRNELICFEPGMSMLCAPKSTHVLSEDLLRVAAEDLQLPAGKALEREIAAAIRRTYPHAIRAGWVAQNKHLGPDRSKRGWVGLGFKSEHTKFGKYHTPTTELPVSTPTRPPLGDGGQLGRIGADIPF